ncbi:lysylphosphatidylglycerol synthase domain-containing protein [Roseateles chitosanitabidus]|uniref:lysylphosphatidylglycerol synthase domain-containing protein n=1 Tax=Roseateles chitosanitabidus TaxID=65048 RepID=UPI0008346335|nr:lysylphosphatidylglycerol synthase domain-containing protein [Roseateles chitosanitabidus]
MRADGSAADHPRRDPPARRPGRWLGAIFGIAIVALLAWAASHVAWDQVGDALRQLPAGVLATAAALCALSHLVYSGYDLIGKHWTRHAVPARRVMLITFISYAFNLNLGSLVGAIAMRLRLYAREGLAQPIPTQVLGLSLASNWLGYGALAGGLLMAGWLAPPPTWPVGTAALRGLGALMWLVVVGYVAVCAFAQGRGFSVRGHDIVVPGPRIALMQIAISAANWMVMGAIVWVLLRQGVPYPQVLAVLLAAAVAGAVTHVPAGLGVLEGVFIALLGPTLGHGQVLAGLIAYRALYYLGPLLIAATAYFVLEARGRR